MKSELVDLTLRIVRDKPIDRAILVQEDFGSEKVWLPRSEIEIEYVGGQRSDTAKITMPEWLAIDKGLV
jgi:hypothetical protein